MHSSMNGSFLDENEKSIDYVLKRYNILRQWLRFEEDSYWVYLYVTEMVGRCLQSQNPLNICEQLR